jgi:ABC-2 type transport system permease protein
MRLYWEVARTTARRMATYRVATLAGVATNTAFAFLLAAVLVAVWRERGTIGGFDRVDAVTYTFVAQALLMPVGLFGSRDIALRIRSGEVAMDLSRPYDFQAFWAADQYGKAAFYLLGRGLPPFLAGALVLDVRVPAGVGTWLAFAGGLVLAVGVAFAYGFLLQLTAFWVLDVRGPNQIGWITAQFLAGMQVPLVLFPDRFEPVARALPFAAMLNTPVELFLGRHTGADLLRTYAGQLAWLVVLAGLGRVVMARAVRRVVVHGG